MASINAILTIEILTAWHLGSGREGGAYADSLVNKNHLGLPVVNGKSIKGLLRTACAQSANFQWLEGIAEEDVSRLFGTEGTGLEKQGVIKVSSATLSEGEEAYFKDNPAAIKHLYRVDHNTAIDHKTGTAKDTSLRSTESVIPMTLQARISFNDVDASNNQRYFDWVQRSLPLVSAVGAKRRRGYGEAVLSLVKEDN
ncbi:RAMP superfamily CRISPR-associated protein [Oligella urethralis]|uniref:RAMP superfamily CRISPR-associated protein n=1 Tax=Oligella urethralis TaxID=90245 RepID=UPI000E011ABB|nr:RAMP superfamily CRISPR-associated protein [Oligella urethralis]SUA57376.1 CRISPR type III-A/MTUBE-associated RAMP protein Csm3 [Oligella urethralis]